MDYVASIAAFYYKNYLGLPSLIAYPYNLISAYDNAFKPFVASSGVLNSTNE